MTTTPRPGARETASGAHGTAPRDPDARGTGSATAELLAAVERWVADDVDRDDQDELRALLARCDEAAVREELASRFAGPLEFGTAGLRGTMAAGPHRMNRAVVVRAAAGLAAFLLDAVGADPAGAEALGTDAPSEPGAAGTGAGRATGDASSSGREAAAPLVVIGYDARHRSHDFALDSAGVLTAAGARVLLLPRALPTPVLAFAVRRFGADAGIMVTASHNPAPDNGYKVYLGGRVVTGAGQGAQIVPPYDAAIAARIRTAPPAREVPRAAGGWQTAAEDLVEEYLETVRRSGTRHHDNGPAPRASTPVPGPRVVTTAMHGVGGPLLAAALRRAGFADVVPVPQQESPNPDFPTVAFPNPEEPGALDLALDLAASTAAGLVLAVDPDADRCAVAVRDPHLDGAWRVLHGDEVGVLLGEEAAGRWARAGGDTGAGSGAGTASPVLASSIVSSRLLARVAEHHGLEYRATLTGFKWIARVEGLVLGYEEAIGYCVDPARVRDKDGISAAVAVARLARGLARRGRGLVDALDGLARRHGLYLSSQVSVRFSDPTALDEAVARLLAEPPSRLGLSPVTEVRDLSAPGTTGAPDALPPTTGISLLADDGTRVIVRPSGTEPKVKAYLEVVEPVGATATYEAVGEARAAARARIDAVADQVRGSLLG